MVGGGEPERKGREKLWKMGEESAEHASGKSENAGSKRKWYFFY